MKSCETTRPHIKTLVQRLQPCRPWQHCETVPVSGIPCGHRSFPTQAFHAATCHVQGSDRGPAGETAVDRFLDTGVGVKASDKKDEMSLPQTRSFFARMKKVTEQSCFASQHLQGQHLYLCYSEMPCGHFVLFTKNIAITVVVVIVPIHCHFRSRRLQAQTPLNQDA